MVQRIMASDSTSPSKSCGSGEWEHTNTDKSFDSTDQSSPPQSGSNWHRSFDQRPADGSVSVVSGAHASGTGDDISEVRSEDVEGFGAAEDSNLSITEYSEDGHDGGLTPVPNDYAGPSAPYTPETNRTSNLADRRGQTPRPVRFSLPNLKVDGESAIIDDSPDGVPSVSPKDNEPDAVKTAMVNIMVKLELLPAIIALRASAKPGADPREAQKAEYLARKARESAESRKADPKLVAQCTYYEAVANFAVGASIPEKTLKLLKHAAADMEPEGPERRWANSWMNFVKEQAKAKEEQEKAEEAAATAEAEANSWSGSMIASFAHPITSMVGALRGSGSNSKPQAKPAKKESLPKPGLYAQIAPHRRAILATRPATKRMPLSTTSSDPPPLTRQTSNTEPSISSWHSSQSSRPKTPPLQGPRRDSQGNFEHYRTGLMYNEEFPFGIDVPFTESPQRYRETRAPKRRVPPRMKELRVVNPDAKMSGSVGVGAADSVDLGDGEVYDKSGQGESKEEEEDQSSMSHSSEGSRRRGSWRNSWFQRLGMAAVDRETGSPTKSLEALAEEGESPMFKPKGWGTI